MFASTIAIGQRHVFIWKFSMKQHVLGLIALLVFATPVAALAVTQGYEGPCPYTQPEGTKWTLVITLDENGNVTRREGFTCAGDHWVDHCDGRVIVPSPPAPTSDYFGAGPGGSWIRFNTDDYGHVELMWGYDANGVYWKSDDSALTTN